MNVRPPYFGAAYYPEGLTGEQIDFDIAKMKETGVNAVEYRRQPGRLTLPCLAVDRLTGETLSGTVDMAPYQVRELTCRPE